MPPFIPIAGIVILFGWLLSRSGSKKKYSSPEEDNFSLPADPLKQPIKVVSPPSSKTPADVQKEVDKILKKKAAGGSTKPSIPMQTPPSDGKTTYQDWADPNDAGRLATGTPTSSTKTREVPDSILTYVQVPGGEKDIRVPNSPIVTVVKPDVPVVPLEGRPPIELLNHSLLPRPTGPVVKIARVSNVRQARDYALKGFHAAVDFSLAAPGKPVELVAYAAENYFQAANAAQANALSESKEAIKKANAIMDRAVKERSGA